MPSDCKRIHLILFALASTTAINVACRPAWAQSESETQKPADRVGAYFSKADELLTVRKATVLPVADNLDGIYARPIEAQLTALVKASRKWDFVESPSEANANLTELEESSTAFKKLVSGIEADAFFAATASKGPAGLSIKLDLFLKADGRMLAQESVKDRGRFDLPDVKEQVRVLYSRVIAKLPYDALVLSRQQNRVTVNLGRTDGAVVGQMLTVVQIIDVIRHPKFGFLVSTEKEIIGKIKVLKVDEGLSFGTIVSERERGAIKRFAKISSLDPVVYPETSDLSTAGGASGPRADGDVSFGKGASEWVPSKPPAFGQVGLKLGAGQYNGSVNVTGVGNLEAKASLFPQLDLFTELWLNPNWQVRAEIVQGVVSTPNPRSGSSPSTLNESLSKYELTVGYNFLLRDDFFGPKFQLSAGFASYRMYIDDSQPLALTTATYSGFVVGVGGSMPLTDKKDWYLGGKTNLILFPSLAESPSSSGGSPKNSVNDFSLFVERKIGENLRGIASIDFALYSTSFSGPGSRMGPSGPETATTMSQRLTSLSAGIEYLF